MGVNASLLGLLNSQFSLFPFAPTVAGLSPAIMLENPTRLQNIHVRLSASFST